MNQDFFRWVFIDIQVAVNVYTYLFKNTSLGIENKLLIVIENDKAFVEVKKDENFEKTLFQTLIHSIKQLERIK